MNNRLFFLHILADFTEKVLYSPADDQHHSLENFSKQNLFKEEETSWSNAMDRMESDSAEGCFKLISLPILHSVLSSVSFLFVHVFNKSKLT